MASSPLFDSGLGLTVDEQQQHSLVLTQQHCRNLEAALEQAQRQSQTTIELQAQLDWIKTSKFWKLRSLYMQCKQWGMRMLRLDNHTR